MSIKYYYKKKITLAVLLVLLSSGGLFALYISNFFDNMSPKNVSGIITGTGLVIRSLAKRASKIKFAEYDDDTYHVNEV